MAIKTFAGRVFSARITAEERQLKETASPESLGRWEAIAAGTLTLDANEAADMPILRMCLLDFIADFANWDNSTVPAYLETSRALTQAAHEALGGAPGTRPLVVDPFAGGGAIPLEALRVGADAFASDLNPVAALLNTLLLEHIPRFRQELADEVRKWGQWVKAQAHERLRKFYPKDADGSTPIAYLWARAIQCEGPGCGARIPLLKSLALATEGSARAHLQLIPDERTKSIRIAITSKPVGSPTVKAWTVTCPLCDYTNKKQRVQAQLAAERGGAATAMLTAVAIFRPGDKAKHFRAPDDFDLCAIRTAVEQAALFPVEADTFDSPKRGGHRAVCSQLPLYGFTTYGDFFTPRQKITLACLSQAVRDVGSDHPISDATRLALACCVGKQADYLSSLCRWRADGAYVNPTLGGEKKYVMVSDFAEACPLSDGPANWMSQIDWVCRVIEQEQDKGLSQGTIVRSAAQVQPLPDGSASAFITDPPYYDSVPYSDLSNFFLPWLRQSLGSRAVGVLGTGPAPKGDEATVDHPGNQIEELAYEDKLTKAFEKARIITKPEGIGVIVFAHKSTSGWEALLGAIIGAGWRITASWPIDTEMQTRLNAKGTASLASSVHICCVPREEAGDALQSAIGEWRDVLDELPKRIHEWMPRLAAEGVVGADAIFACLGPALEIFSRYSRVEKSNGEAATLREYLEHVWASVSTEALSLIFKDADAAGLEPDARLTAMWLWTIGGGTNGNGKKNKTAESAEQGEREDGDGETSASSSAASAAKGFGLEYDAARKIAQGLGVHLEQCETLVEVKGDKARLLPVSERAQHLFGKGTHAAATSGRKKKVRQTTLFDQLDEAEAADAGWSQIKGPAAGNTVLDRVHQAMILFAANRGELLKRFLVEDGVGKDARFWKLADNLNKLYPTGTEERRWVEGVMARKKGLGL